MNEINNSHTDILASLSEFGLRLEELAKKQNVLISNLLTVLKDTEGL